MRDFHLGKERRVVQRRYAPKTRTGCITCKVRRVKCDEARPSCERCTSTGRKCDGYTSQSPLEAKANNSVESISPALTVDVTCDALEKRTFDFFRSKTAPCFSGYFQDSIWERTILQVSHSEPVVRHAINALGAQHEENVLRRTTNGSVGSECRTSFPVTQYSKALIGLQKLLTADKVSMDLVLMCSLACIHFEALRESFVPALIHTENAIRLLHSRTTFNAQTIDPTLVRALMRIDVQGAMYLGMRVPGLPFYTAASDSTLPSAFHSLIEARDLVESWTCRMYHFMRTYADDYKFREPCVAPLELIARAQDLEQTFIDLDTLLWNFMHQPNFKMTAREHHGVNILRCRVKMNRMFAACCLYSEVSMYDAYLEEFEEILAICTFIMSSGDGDQWLFSVSLDEGLLFPIWFVATHCRDSVIRHRALRLLKRLPNGRNIWHVEAMTRTAEICVGFEEAGCWKDSPKCADISEWKRVHSAGLDGTGVSSTQRRLKVYLRTRPNGMDGEWVEMEQMIEW